MAMCALPKATCFAILLAMGCLLLNGCGGGSGTGTTSTSTRTTTTTTVPFGECLCVFDIDRTLTGKQSATKECPANQIVDGVTDLAYGGGTLTLSAAAHALNSTFCAKCYNAICSSGVVSGKSVPERARLFESLGGNKHLLSDYWSDAAVAVKSGLVLNARHGQKQDSVRKIVDWFATQNVTVADANVFFFDDDPINVKPFTSTKFNAHQVSCSSRDPTHPRGSDVGFCGATTAEIVMERGVQVCYHQAIGSESFV